MFAVDPAKWPIQACVYTRQSTSPPPPSPPRNDALEIVLLGQDASLPLEDKGQAASASQNNEDLQRTYVTVDCGMGTLDWLSIWWFKDTCYFAMITQQSS
jgi:hypothetical protein